MNRKQRRTSAAQGCPAPIAAAPDLAGMFAGALRHHQAGRLHPAELLYRQVLAANPRHADSLHLLGLIADQAGFRDQAEALIRRAVTACRATINVRIRDNQDERAFRLWRLREGGARPEAPEPESSAPTSCLGTGTVW